MCHRLLSWAPRCRDRQTTTAAAAAAAATTTTTTTTTTCTNHHQRGHHRKHPPCRMLDGAWNVSPEGPYRSLEELWDTQQEQRTSAKE